MAPSQWAVNTSVDTNNNRVCADATGFVRLTPEQCYLALCAPEGSSIWRVEQRAHRGGGGGPGDPLQEDVTIVAPMRVLFWKKWARTRVRQCADLSASGAAVTVTFELIQSDLMSKLEGSWAFTLQTPTQPGGWPLSRVQYRFCMWPKGVPSALRRLPGLMDAVQGAVARESGQMLDKLAFVEGKMAHPSMLILDAVRIAAAEVDSAGSYKKLAKRAAKTSAAAAASKPRPQAPGGRVHARPQVAVLAHRLSFESQSSVDSLPSFDAMSSDGADDAPAPPRSPRARRGGSSDGSSGSGGSATSDEGGRGRDVFGSDCGSSDCDGDGGTGRDQRGRVADAGLRMAKTGPFVRPGDGLVSLS